MGLNNLFFMFFYDIIQILNGIRIDDVIALDDHVILVIDHGNDGQRCQRGPLIKFLEPGVGRKEFLVGLVELRCKILYKILYVHITLWCKYVANSI